MSGVLDWLSVNSGCILVLLVSVLVVLFMAQFELSRRSSQRQLRAYVIPDGSKIFVGETGEPRATISFRNCGQTPARGVVGWARMDLIDSETEEESELPQVAVRSATTLAANGSLSKALWFRTLSPEEVDLVRSGRKTISVSGLVRYSDIFRRRHETQFRLAYSGPYPPRDNASLDPASRGNRET